MNIKRPSKSIAAFVEGLAQILRDQIKALSSRMIGKAELNAYPKIEQIALLLRREIHAIKKRIKKR